MGRERQSDRGHFISRPGWSFADLAVSRNHGDNFIFRLFLVA
jgi:hypothetical protein